MIENDLYKNRSIARCIKAAFLLFYDNVATNFKKNWLPTIVVAILGGVFMAWRTVQGYLPIGACVPSSVSVAYIVFYLLYVLSLVWYVASITNMLNDNGLKCNIRRNIKLALFIAAILVVLYAIITYVVFGIIVTTVSKQLAQCSTAQIATWPYALCLLVFLLLLMPFNYSAIKYIHQPGATFKTHVLGGYKTGLRYLGFIFSVQLLFAVIFCFIVLLIAMPMVLLVLSFTLSYSGVVQGDANTLPVYFPILLYGTSIIVYFIFTAIISISVYVSYYVYGAIETRQEERKKRKQLQQTGTTTT